MLSARYCKGILGKSRRTYSNEQILIIIAILYKLAEIEHNNYIERVKR